MYYRNSTPDIPVGSTIETGLTKLTGYVRDSGNQPISNGWIELTADGIITDGSTDNRALIIPKPARFPLSDQPLDIDLINSQYSETTYQIRVGETNSGIDTVWVDFHAQIPYGKIVDISSLTPSSISRESIPTTIYRVAELMLADPVLSNKLKQIFRFRGDWQPGTTYRVNDLVFVPGSPNKSFIAAGTFISGSTFVPGNWQQLI